MSAERWDVPSERLRRIADRPEIVRLCANCPHAHPKGERCGYPIPGAVCDCIR